MKHDFKTEAELCAAFIAWVKVEELGKTLAAGCLQAKGGRHG